MRRHDTISVGEAAEAEAARLLRERGYAVENLNASARNHMTYDLVATRNGVSTKISVKCARAKRDLSLGNPKSVLRLEPGTFMIAFLPSDKGRECSVSNGDYEVWIVPAEAIIEDALGAHAHYWAGEPEKHESNTVRVKDKVDRPGGRSRAGQVFQSWSARYRDAWSLLP